MLKFLDSKKVFYENKGLSWKIPPKFPYWIELWLDYKFKPVQPSPSQLITPDSSFTRLNAPQLLGIKSRENNCDHQE